MKPILILKLPQKQLLQWPVQLIEIHFPFYPLHILDGGLVN